MKICFPIIVKKIQNKYDIAIGQVSKINTNIK